MCRRAPPRGGGLEGGEKRRSRGRVMRERGDGYQLHLLAPDQTQPKEEVGGHHHHLGVVVSLVVMVLVVVLVLVMTCL